MTDARTAIINGLKKQNKSMAWLSRQLGKNRAYIQQHIERGSPHELDLNQKVLVSELLHLPLSSLGVSNLEVKRSRPSGAVGGLNEDAEIYEIPVGSILSPDPMLGYFVMRSDSLATHPLKIMRGDIVIFNLSPEAIETVKTEQIVLVQCYDKSEFLNARTLIREFVRPNLVMTNKPTANELFSLDDPTLPFEAHIRGVFKNFLRGND